MPEKTTEKIEETGRRYMREAEDIAQGAFRRSNDFMAITMKYYFNTFDTFMRYNMEFTDHARHAMDDMMTTYRRYYTEGVKSWEDYFNDTYKIVYPPTK